MKGLPLSKMLMAMQGEGSADKEEAYHCGHPDEAPEIHLCPFQGDIHNDPTPCCYCCERCEQDCADDI